ncbi:hypothetical protein CLU95_5523 [Variovorax sp. 54]|uniref:Ig-like domain-containing protein n=1 Tax=Variovorax sp. 54 TaxID=2035212 RepID=UPI000C1A66A2|nr:Ig-like domain-containing protein [Variovorax sp. 54]PIF78338.1 hypothetical protein CLU95_5523 [Variovorax sp. 54]
MLSDDAGDITGPINSGSTTDDSTPTYTGKTEPNATVVIYDHGTEIGRVPADAQGNWSFTPTTPLLDGAHELAHAVIDVAGNLGAKSPAIDFTLDTRDVTVSITGAEDNVGSVIGAIAKDGVTDDTTPTLNGKATADGIVKIYNGKVLLGQTVADANGDWSFTPSTELGDGLYKLNATVTTQAGGESKPTADFALTVDTQAPTRPTIELVEDDVGDIRGPLAHGASTDDFTPTLSGKAEANSTVSIYSDGGNLLGKVTADTTGNWSFTTTQLNSGTYNFTVVSEDKAGNRSEPSNPWEVTVDLTPPAKPTIVSVVDDVGGVTGNLTSGSTIPTDDTQPDFKGTAEANSTVVIHDKGVEVARVQADASGNWAYTPAAGLNNGAHSFTVTAVDKAGNVSAPSAPFDFTVDTVPPPKPTIVMVMDDVGSVQGELYSGGVTDDTKPVVTGKAEANSTVIVYDNGVEVTRVQANASGDWTYTPAAALVDGGHSFSAVAVNKAGTASVPSASFGFTVDTVAPAAPAITDAYDDVGNSQGSIGNGAVTDDKRPVLNGTGEPGATIALKDGSAVIGTTTVGSDGKWSFLPNGDLALGNHSLTATQTDRAGNQSLSSNPFELGIGSVGNRFEGFESMALQVFSEGVQVTTPNGLQITPVKSGTLGDMQILATSPSNPGDGRQALVLSTNSITRFDFAEGSGVQYNLFAVHSLGSAKYYDAQGALLGSSDIKTGVSSTPYSFTAPAGKAVAYMTITVGPEGVGDHGIMIDSISWLGIVVPSTVVLNAMSTEIHDQQPFTAFGAVSEDGDQTHVASGVHADDTVIARFGFADRLEGGAGNDTFLNVGTGDVVHGGAGNDTVHVNSGDFERIDGGLGIDTLVMDGKSMHIDLSALGLKVQGFEKFDLGAGGNTLALSAHDVLAGGARDMAMADGKVQMLVNGANGEVDLLGGTHGDDGWTQGGNATVGGMTYHVYTNLAGTAELLVEDKVHVTIL